MEVMLHEITRGMEGMNITHTNLLQVWKGLCTMMDGVQLTTIPSFLPLVQVRMMAEYDQAHTSRLKITVLVTTESMSMLCMRMIPRGNIKMSTSRSALVGPAKRDIIF